jgi:hypothetical protein
MRRAIVLIAVLAACTPSPGPQTPPSGPTSTPATTSAPSNEITDDAPLVEGHVVFRGMVRPTKGGYEVRGAIVDGSLFRKALVGAPDDVLGAVVRIEGELQKHAAVPAQGPGGEFVQTRQGPWFEVTRVDSATVVAPAQTIEGTLGRSKGFFTLAGRLISREDVAWSLAPEGGHEGDRVRLYGQPRTVVCEPQAQCLIEGSLPLFDVGRAERLP